MVSNLPAKRLTIKEKLEAFSTLRDAIGSKLEKLKEVVKLNPMKAARVAPKVFKMTKTAKVITHKSEAMGSLSKAHSVDLVSFERHLDRAITAAELLDGILDDTLNSQVVINFPAEQFPIPL